MAGQPRLTHNSIDLGGVELGEDHLARTGGVGRFALAQRGVKTHRPSTVHSLDEDGVSVVVHRQSRGESRLFGEFVQEGEADLGERGVLRHQVAEAQECETQVVSRTGLFDVQQPEVGEGTRGRTGRTLGHLDRVGEFGQGKPALTRVSHGLENLEGATRRS